MVFLLNINRTSNKIKVKLCSLIVLAAFSGGAFLQNVYVYKTHQTHVELFKRNIYAVHKDSGSTGTSNLDCLNRCIAVADGYSTICAGIMFRSNETSTVCTMLYPKIGNVQDLSTMKGADIIASRGKCYWYHPKIGKIIYYFHIIQICPDHSDSSLK